MGVGEGSSCAEERVGDAVGGVAILRLKKMSVASHSEKLLLINIPD